MMSSWARETLGRAWLPTNQRQSPQSTRPSPIQRLDAYRNCLDPRISDHALNEWFLYETVAANGSGVGRAVFEVRLPWVD